MLIDRETYVQRALLFRDTDLVKVVTGVRRCGKSSCLELVRERIEAEGVEGRGFVSANLEARGLGVRTDDDLYAFQVADEMFGEQTRQREIAPLRSIRDNHGKMVVVRQGTYERDVDGIRIVTARDFFL